MEKNEWSYKELFSELTNYEQSGIDIEMEGTPASPLQVVSAYMIQEEHAYMRDYVVGEDGKIKKIEFHKLNK